jgi:hypothetical protein
VEMGFPIWLRIVVALSALMQFGFGITLLVDPSRIGDVWPWVMPPLTTRVLAASTLVSVPLALLAIGINRYAVAAIPFVMMGAYRVVQIAAGLFHLDRFAHNKLMATNYFGGGLLMLLVFAYGIWAGQNQRLPSESSQGPWANPLPWLIATPLRVVLGVLGSAYFVIGILFFTIAGTASSWWIDARGMTPLTARLFSSPLIGLGLGLFLVSRATDWRAVAVPALGMVTVGIVVLLALFLGRADFAPQTAMSWLVAATPLVLLTAGVAILASWPRV